MLYLFQFLSSIITLLGIRIPNLQSNTSIHTNATTFMPFRTIEDKLCLRLCELINFNTVSFISVSDKVEIQASVFENEYNLNIVVDDNESLSGQPVDKIWFGNQCFKNDELVLHFLHVYLSPNQQAVVRGSKGWYQSCLFKIYILSSNPTISELDLIFTH